MNNLIKYCDEISYDKDKEEIYSSSSNKLNKYIGKFYRIFSTNIRELQTYVKDFKKMEEVEDLIRASWPKKEKTGQELHKQYIRPMETSRLFENINSKYYKTFKGKKFGEFIELSFTSQEQWILIFFFLLDSNTEYISNYLIDETNKIINFLEELENKYNLSIFNQIENLVKNEFNVQGVIELFDKDIFLIHTFYKDKKFLEMYFSSPKIQKEEYIQHLRINFKQNNIKDCFLVHKYSKNSNYTKGMFLEEIKILHYCKELINLLKMDKDNKFAFENIAKLYCNNLNISHERIINFLQNYKEVFGYILNSVFNEVINNEEKNLIKQINQNQINNFLQKKPVEKLEETNYNNLKKGNQRFNKYKDYAKSYYQYRCFFENKNKCNYFSTGNPENNYVEIHHIIPQSFANIFEYSIEVLDNYVALCPTCHRMIHLGIDSWREPYIKELFNMRSSELKKYGLEIKYEQLKSFYKIKTE